METESKRILGGDEQNEYKSELDKRIRKERE